MTARCRCGAPAKPRLLRRPKCDPCSVGIKRIPKPRTVGGWTVERHAPVSLSWQMTRQDALDELDRQRGAEGLRRAAVEARIAALTSVGVDVDEPPALAV